MNIDFKKVLESQTPLVLTKFNVLKRIEHNNAGSTIELLSRNGVPTDRLWRKYVKQGYLEIKEIKTPKSTKASKPKPKLEDNVDV